MIMKSRLVFLDANIIIEAHRLDIWKHIISQFEVVIPSYILDNEVKYFKSAGGDSTSIDLAANEKAEQIKREIAVPDDFKKLYTEFKSVFVDGLDAGEKEALALLYSGRFPEHRFCTGDGAAIKALSVTQLQFQGVSFESLMKESGKAITNFSKHFREDFFKKNIAAGQTERDIHRKDK